MRDVHLEDDRILVTWVGEVHARPDSVEIVLGVAANAESAEEALADSAEQVDDLLGHLSNAGVPRRQVSVAGPTVGALVPPLIDPTRKPPRGFTVRTYLRVREDFEPDQAAQVIQWVATVLDAAAKGDARLANHGSDGMGLGLVSGGEVTFLLRDSSEARSRALADAVAATRPVAEGAAAAAGGTLGALLGLHVGPPTMEQLQQAARQREFPLDPNEVCSSLINDVVVRVNVVAAYRLVQGD